MNEYSYELRNASLAYAFSKDIQFNPRFLRSIRNQIRPGRFFVFRFAIMWNASKAIIRATLMRNINQKLFHKTTTIESFKKGRGTGDQGKSSLFNNERRWKNDDVFEALGSIDELSSYIGICREKIYKQGLFDISDMLINIQSCLQDLGAHIATPSSSSEAKLSKTKFDESAFDYINKHIDIYGDRTPPLHQFVLPGGGDIGASLQNARAVCRRAERRLVCLIKDEAIDEHCLRLLNRLSDLLFILGRYITCLTSEKEVIHRPVQCTLKTPKVE